MRANLEVVLSYEAAGGGHDAAVEASLAEVDRMTRIVEDMLTLSRIDARQELLRYSVVDVSGLLERLVEAMRPLAEADGVRFELSLTGDLNVRCDADHLQRALVNVVRNAVQQSAPGDAVRIAAAEGRDRIELSVSDDGPGIDPAELPHLFERHFRTAASRTRNDGGSGVGLAITKWVVAQHGGTVSVGSVLGSGTTVRISLPRPSAS